MSSNQINTPFQKGPAPTPTPTGPDGGTFNHHQTNGLDVPRDGGKDLPLKFFSGMTGTPTEVTSPFQGITGPVKK